MQLEEAIAQLTTVEQNIQLALDEERFDDLNTLGVESQRLVKAMCDAELNDEDRVKFREFASAYVEHIEDMLKSLQKTKDETKSAIIKLNKSTKGSHRYAQIATGRK